MLTTGELVVTGIIMGIIHVLTGPDHLSALATLSGTDVTNRNTNNFLLGVKWGIGHSAGLIVVAAILIAIEEQSTSKSEWIGGTDSTYSALSELFEWFVGAFMVGLGLYGLRKACRHNRPPDFIETGSSCASSSVGWSHGDAGGGTTRDDKSVQSSIIGRMEGILLEDEEEQEQLNNDGQLIQSMKDGAAQQQSREGRMLGLYEDEQMDPEVLEAAASLLLDPDTQLEEDELSEEFLAALKASTRDGPSESFLMYQSKNRSSLAKLSKAKTLVRKHAKKDNSTANEMRRSTRRWYNSMCTTSALALMAGIVHGVAGPGGVLGVIPAVQLREPKLATIYLTMFCATSTFVMGCFASFYGSFSEWLALSGNLQHQQQRGGGVSNLRVFFVELGSALLSIGVGVVWLVLLSVGKTEEMFQ